MCRCGDVSGGSGGVRMEWGVVVGAVISQLPLQTTHRRIPLGQRRGFIYLLL